jgi:hypothetical protein
LKRLPFSRLIFRAALSLAERRKFFVQYAAIATEATANCTNASEKRSREALRFRPPSPDAGVSRLFSFVEVPVKTL